MSGKQRGTDVKARLSIVEERKGMLQSNIYQNIAITYIIIVLHHMLMGVS
jgi:hypothetical protein